MDLKIKHKFSSLFLKNKDNHYEQKCVQYKNIERYMLDYAQYIQNNKLIVTDEFDSSTYLDQELKLKAQESQILSLIKDYKSYHH